MPPVRAQFIWYRYVMDEGAMGTYDGVLAIDAMGMLAKKFLETLSEVHAQWIVKQDG